MCRGKGMTQSETAKFLHTSRANVSMIERRARAKIGRARETIAAFESTLTDHRVVVPKGTHVYDIPRAVLGEADRIGVHLQSNIVDIVRMVKGIRPSCLAGRKTNRRVAFVFNQRGKLAVAGNG